MAGEFDDIRGRLEAIAEELADLAIERLRESIDAGGTELPVDERRLTRARRAVEKAAGILAEPDDHRSQAVDAGAGARRPGASAGAAASITAAQRQDRPSRARSRSGATSERRGAREPVEGVDQQAEPGEGHPVEVQADAGQLGVVVAAGLGRQRALQGVDAALDADVGELLGQGGHLRRGSGPPPAG